MISVKRGDTFSLTAKWLDSANQPITDDVTKLRAQVRTEKDALLGEFTISLTGTAGEYYLEMLPSTTALWPVGKHYFDIQYTASPTEVISSDTVKFEVEKDVTHL